MQKDVSVVVPVYNTERFLPKCIESLINQTLKNVEFFFVDDGSTDRSSEIIETYQKQDSRIHLIRQENLNAGAARNNGLEKATGKYIIFLDADDYFEPDMLKLAFQCAEKNRAQITVFGYYNLSDTDHSVIKAKHGALPKGVFSLEKAGERIFDFYIAAPWNKLFLRSFIVENDLRFQTIRRSNDTYFTHMAAFLADRIVYFPKRLVYYRVNNINSLQGNPNKDRSSIIVCKKAIKTKLKELGIFYGVYKKAYERHLKIILHTYGEIDKADFESYRLFFDELKKELVPGLFDSPDDFKDDPWITHIYNDTYDSFLFFLSSQYMFPKDSTDYRLGHTIVSKLKTTYYFLLRRKWLQRDGETGLLYSSGDIEDLVKKIEYCIAHPAEAREIAKQGQSAAMREFTADRNAKQVNELYKDLIETE